jgi:hypothetical protein
VKGDHIVFSWPAVAILSTQVLLGLAALGVTAWVHCRKKSFY